MALGAALVARRAAALALAASAFAANGVAWLHHGVPSASSTVVLGEGEGCAVHGKHAPGVLSLTPLTAMPPRFSQRRGGALGGAQP